MNIHNHFFQQLGRDVILVLSLIFTLAIHPALADVTIFQEDFESGGSNWYTDNGVWQVGTPTTGPSACFGGTQCAGTVLAGNYPAFTDSRFITLTPVQLPIVAGDEEISLRFRQWFSYSSFDAGYVQISVDGGATFTTVGNTVTEVSPWSLMGVDLTAYAGQLVQIAFYHTATRDCCNTSESSGWYIDDIKIVHKEPAPVFTGNFEAGLGDWHADRGQWQAGVPTAGPTGCYNDSLGCIGTVLDGGYYATTDSRLVSPSFWLPSVSGNEEIHLRFRQWFSYSSLDTGYVQISTYDGATWSGWTSIGNSIINYSPWTLMGVDLTDYAGQKIRIAFYHTAARDCCNASESTGWYIDDIEIVHKVPAFTGDFELDLGDWYADRGLWQQGLPTSGPGGCFNDSLGCVGTVMDGNYHAFTDSRLVSPTIRLPDTGIINLIFQQWFSFSSFDTGNIYISVFDGIAWSSWTNIAGPFQNTSGGWTQSVAPLTAYASEIVRIAFYHTATRDCCNASESSGWYIDNITLSLAPDIAVSPSSHDFGGVNVGSCSVAQAFDVSNNGNADLQINTITLAGTHAGEYSIGIDNCSGQTIVPAGTCSVDSTFCPTSSGSKSATLSIPSNDLDQPVLNVPLTGTGGSLRLDIRANGVNGPLYITPLDLANITIGLDPGPEVGNVADYWVGRTSTNGTYWFDYDGTGTWVKSDIPESGAQIPMAVQPYVTVDATFLEEGLYTYFFIMDDNPDGILDITWLDYVVIVSSDPAGPTMVLPSNFGGDLRKKLEKIMNK